MNWDIVLLIVISVVLVSIVGTLLVHHKGKTRWIITSLLAFAGVIILITLISYGIYYYYWMPSATPSMPPGTPIVIVPPPLVPTPPSIDVTAVGIEPPAPKHPQLGPRTIILVPGQKTIVHLTDLASASDLNQYILQVRYDGEVQMSTRAEPAKDGNWVILEPSADKIQRFEVHGEQFCLLTNQPNVRFTYQLEPKPGL